MQYNRIERIEFANNQYNAIDLTAKSDYLIFSYTSQYKPSKILGTATNNDIIYATTDNDIIEAKEGNDIIVASSGNDKANGGYGNDILYGQDGNDYLEGEWGSDHLEGGEGDDYLSDGLNGLSSNDSNDYLSGGNGNDYYEVIKTNIKSHTIIEENSRYSNQTDILSLVNVYNENEIAITREVNDLKITILSNGSTITIKNQFSNRYYHGFDEDNKIEYIKFASNSYINIGNYLTSIERNFDYINLAKQYQSQNQYQNQYQNSYQDQFFYYLGIKATGSYQRDILTGTNLNDYLIGEGDNDLLIGEGGIDVLVGGTGNDQFIYKNLNDSTDNASDIILDFVKGEDKITVSGLQFYEITQGYGSSTNWYGIEYYFDGENTIINDPDSDFAIKLAGKIHLDNNDFIF